MISGRATDRTGAPLAEAEVSIYGTSTESGENVSFFPRTAADGTYSIEVPDGSYTVSATHDLAFQGKQYRFTLHPTDGKPAASAPSSAGIVRDFELRVSGLRPDGERNPEAEWSYYGGALDLVLVDVKDESFQTNHFSAEFPEGFRAEVTLTPEGPLADGSTGAPVVTEHTMDSKFDAEWEVLDVPVGRYVVTGRAIKPDGSVRDLKVVGVTLSVITSTHAPQDSGTLVFEPETGVTGGVRKMAARFAYGAPYPPVE